MSESNENLALLFNPEVLPPEGESVHAVSRQASEVIRLAQDIRGYHFAKANCIPRLSNRRDTMTDEEAMVAGDRIDQVYATYFDDPDNQTRQGSSAGVAYKCDRIIEAVRETWSERYYAPRTREATLDDFQAWFDPYLDTYGDLALNNLHFPDRTFEDIYHPFESGSLKSANPPMPGMPITNLRIATDDLELIEGGRRAKFAVIAPPGISVEQYRSSEGGHAIFSLDPTKQLDIPMPLLVPSDIK